MSQDCAQCISRGLCVAFKRHTGAEGWIELCTSCTNTVNETAITVLTPHSPKITIHNAHQQPVSSTLHYLAIEFLCHAYCRYWNSFLQSDKLGYEQEECECQTDTTASRWRTRPDLWVAISGRIHWRPYSRSHVFSKDSVLLTYRKNRNCSKILHT